MKHREETCQQNEERRALKPKDLKEERLKISILEELMIVVYN
jgi:hypothetical protein